MRFSEFRGFLYNKKGLPEKQPEIISQKPEDQEYFLRIQKYMMLIATTVFPS